MGGQNLEEVTDYARAIMERLRNFQSRQFGPACPLLALPLSKWSKAHYVDLETCPVRGEENIQEGTSVLVSYLLMLKRATIC